MAAQPQFDFSGMYGDSSGGGNNSQSAQGWGGVGDLFGAGLTAFGMNSFQNPADSAMPYLNGIQGQMQPYFQPYMDAGKSALPTLQGQYNQLMNNPTAVMNGIGSTYQQSPGYQFQVNQAQNSANHAAAAGGMLGSPAEQQSIAGTVNNLANQDYNTYLNQGLGLYSQGLQGMQGLNQMGYNASTGFGDDIGSIGQSQANLAYAGAANQNQSQQGAMGGIGGLVQGGISAMGMAGWL